MARAAFLLLLVLLGSGEAASARETVDASVPTKVSVTVYRDPNRGSEEAVDRSAPRGFAMISETRTVTLPRGESTIRFVGVAEGMVGVSAIVTGLPGGTIEKNRNAALLSPASLVDGTLGNRVTVTRTNLATGAPVSQDAIVRTRADGGLVLQTSDGFEAVRCSGLPEKLTFGGVPAGLSAQPVFSIVTRDASGGTYQVELTYISWGFDWEAHYVATHSGKGRDSKERLQMRSWLTVVNDNGQSFEDAQLLVVAGRLNIASDFQALAAPPLAQPLSLTCYPLGHTADGSPVVQYAPPPAPPPMVAYGEAMVVSGSRIQRRSVESNSPITTVDKDVLAGEEALGDLKLYRMPEPVTVAAKSMKQVAFLIRDDVKGAFQHRFVCTPWEDSEEPEPVRMWFMTKNDKKNGLGASLPMGGVTMFEPSSFGDQLVAESAMRDYAEGRDVEFRLGESPNAFGLCLKDNEVDPYSDGYPWVPMHATLTNANPHPVSVRVVVGDSLYWKFQTKAKGLAVRDGYWSIEQVIPANASVKIAWELRSNQSAEETGKTDE